MSDRISSAVGEILESPEINLTKFERHVLRSILKKTTVSRDTQSDFEDSRTFGERLADQVAQIGGSWTFIVVYICFLIGWIT